MSLTLRILNNKSIIKSMDDIMATSFMIHSNSSHESTGNCKAMRYINKDSCIDFDHQIEVSSRDKNEDFSIKCLKKSCSIEEEGPTN